MLKWPLVILHLISLATSATGGGLRVKHDLAISSRHRHTLREQLENVEELIKYDETLQNPTTKLARLRADLPVFELVYGQNAEYDLGRALDENVLLRGRPITMWPYDIRPDLSKLSWMAYDGGKRVLTGTPPLTQPPSIYSETLSYLDVYVYIGNGRSTRLRTVLGIFVRPGNVSTVSNANPLTVTPDFPSSIPSLASEQVSRPHGIVLGMLVAACVLLLLLVVGGLGWVIAVRRHLRDQANSVHPADPNQKLPDPIEPKEESTPRWGRLDSHTLQFTPKLGSFAATATRRRVRTAGHGSPGSETSRQQSPPKKEDNPQGTPTSTRKRAATLLQTIHSRAIRGSPKIGSNSKGTLAPLPEVLISKTFSRSERGHSPENKEDVSPAEGKRQFTNSWCSAMQLDPFRSPARSVELAEPTRLSSGEGTFEQPTPATSRKEVWAKGDKTMSVSELFGTPAESESPGGFSGNFEHEGNVGFMKGLSPASTESNQEATPIPHKAPRTKWNGSGGSVETRKAGPLNRAESYKERTSQLGMALLTPRTNTPADKSGQGSMGLSFDSFFSPEVGTRESIAQQEEVPAARYGDIFSERIVMIGRSQETLTTAYVTASEQGVSPTKTSYEASSDGHGGPGDIGIIGSPSTLHSQMAELDDISSPHLTAMNPEGVAKAGSTNRSLGSEYGSLHRSLRTVENLPCRSCFPEDLNPRNPALCSCNQGDMHTVHRAPSDTTLPADGSTRLAASVQGLTNIVKIQRNDSGEYSDKIDLTSLSFAVAQESSRLGGSREEDSILSPDLSERTSMHEDPTMVHGKKVLNSPDSILVSRLSQLVSQTRIDVKVESKPGDRSSNGVKYASLLFPSPRR